MADPIDIAAVARRTGVSSRTLRFYEAKGLLKPLRTASGRRLYGPAELEKLNRILLLRRAGFSLARIAEADSRGSDLPRLIDLQLEALAAQAATLADSRTLLLSAKARLARGEPPDIDTLCAIIRTMETYMRQGAWKPVSDRYLTPEDRAEWADRMAQVPEGFDQEEYSRRWKELGARIEAALPLEPSSEQAQTFVAEWFALLKPFTDVATPAMWSAANRMYDDMDSWQGQADPGFSKAVWDFIKRASASRLLETAK